MAVVGGLATSYCNGTHVGEDLYTGPACSAKEHFIVVGDIVNIAAKKPVDRVNELSFSLDVYELISFEHQRQISSPSSLARVKVRFT